MKHWLAVRQFYGFATPTIKNQWFFKEKLARVSTVLKIRNTDDQKPMVFQKNNVSRFDSSKDS